MKEAFSRRTFVKAGTTATAAFAVPAISVGSQKVLGANERIRLGFIGVANRGQQLMDAFLQHSDCEIVALCDVDKDILAKANGRLGGKADCYEDFRKLLDRTDIHAVVIATPDHWHAIQTIMACKSGKDVYVEKPLSITVVEGRKMVEAARKYKRIVQVGLHRRSSPLYMQLVQLVQEGKVGKITVSRAYRLSNMAPTGIGHAPPTEPPPHLNWDLWLGPRPLRPFQATIHPYKFRWWDLYSSQMANWGVHYLDAMRWVTGDLAPSSVCAMGGRFAVDDDRTIPDTMEAVFEFPAGRLAIFGQYEASGNPIFPIAGAELELRGTIGTAYIGSRTIHVVPERGGQFQDPAPRMEPIKIEGPPGDPTILHARNFLDCIRSREKPNCDVEEGHRSTTCSLIANISLMLRARLDWDPVNERFTNMPEANNLLHYEYRKPWSLEI
jgi:predicted dehydrogenase